MFSQRLIEDAKKYLEKKTDRKLENDELEIFLKRLSNLGSIFIDNNMNMERYKDEKKLSNV